MAAPEKVNRCTSKNGKTDVFSEDLLGVNIVVTNYKIRHNRNQPARYSLAWLDCFYVITCGGGKMKNIVWMCKAACEGSHGGKFAHYVS